MNKLISVVVPIYKVEKYLDRCVESIVKQTYKNLEIILVDDGSPDNCPKMCDEWGKKDKRIKVIHKKNGGLSDARNAGLDVMTGEYVTFVDSDDYLELDAITVLKKALEENDADVAIGRPKFVYENDDSSKNIGLIDNSIICYNNEELIKLLMSHTESMLVVAWGRIFKKEIFKNIRFDVGRLHEDEFIAAKLFSKINKAVLVNYCVYNYLQRRLSITSNKNIKNCEDLYDAFNQRFLLINKLYPDLKKENLLSYCFELRSLYMSCYKHYKPIAKKIVDKFNEIYKLLEKKGYKNFLFKHFRSLYILLCKIKNHKS